ncbi:PEP-CTERM sorting domain-containing protein [Limnospira fusiformis CCALA 023]|uniref:cistern family PEP-CTERM protein n=1 Tax=Oscillatoriales TaxID=1150 RepID=UPI00396E9C9F
MKTNYLFGTALLATSVAIVSSAFLPAAAFNITRTGDQAGNPEQDLWQVGVTTNDIGSTFQVDWFLDRNFDPSGSLSQDLSAFSTFKVDSFTSSYLDLTINISNTTALTQTFTEAGIVSFGFGIDPNATSVELLQSGTNFSGAQVRSAQQTFPGGFKQIDICIFTQGCNGGSQNSALAAGASDSLRLRIGGDFTSGTTTIGANLLDFPVKFQTTDGSFELAGAGGGVGNVEQVPEPLTILGTGMALGFGSMFKREHDKKKKKSSLKA